MALALCVRKDTIWRLNMARPLFAALFLAALPTPVMAEPIEDLDRLDSRIEVMTGAAPGQPGGAIAPIDRRLKLAACPQPASIEWSGSDALAVRCAAIGWRLRVGIAAMGGPRGKAGLSVHRGDTVEVSVEGDAFDVATTALAMDDGAVGASVRLKLGAAGTQSSAIVTGPGTVSFSR
jgi:flagella basal body P-ring formation protein FlgA